MRLESFNLGYRCIYSINLHAQHSQQFQRLQVLAYTRVNIGSMHYLGHMKDPIQSSTRLGKRSHPFNKTM